MVKSKSREVIVAPKETREQIMWITHNRAHAGVISTLRRLCWTWYWPGITSDVRRLVKSCQICKISAGDVRADSGVQNMSSGLPALPNADPGNAVQFNQASNLSFGDEKPSVLLSGRTGKVR